MKLPNQGPLAEIPSFPPEKYQWPIFTYVRFLYSYSQTPTWPQQKNFSSSLETVSQDPGGIGNKRSSEISLWKQK